MRQTPSRQERFCTHTALRRHFRRIPEIIGLLRIARGWQQGLDGAFAASPLSLRFHVRDCLSIRAGDFLTSSNNRLHLLATAAGPRQMDEGQKMHSVHRPLPMRGSLLASVCPHDVGRSWRETVARAGCLLLHLLNGRTFVTLNEDKSSQTEENTALEEISSRCTKLGEIRLA